MQEVLLAPPQPESTQEYASGPFLAQEEEKVFKVWKQGDNKNYILWRNLVGEFKVGDFSEFKTKKIHKKKQIVTQTSS